MGAQENFKRVVQYWSATKSARNQEAYRWLEAMVRMDSAAQQQLPGSFRPRVPFSERAGIAWDCTGPKT
jgi:hypothetical protein